MNIDELEQLAKLATPGPWQSGSDWIETTGDDAFDGDLLIRVAMNSRACSGDLQYIAAANPETILAMIAELREAEKIRLQRDELLAALKIARWWVGDGYDGTPLPREQMAPRYRADIDFIDSAIAKVEQMEIMPDKNR